MGLYNVQAINEMYIGKTKEVQELQQIIHDVRTNYLVDPKDIKNFNKYSDISRDKGLVTLGDKIASIWGFKESSVNVYISEYANAYTYPVTYSLDIEPENMIVKGANGYKYSKKSNFYVLFYISSAVMCNSLYTDEEVMAILLHEIGHSFTLVTEDKCSLVQAGRSCSLTYYISQMFDNPWYAVTLVQNTNMYRKVMAQIQKKNKDGKGVYVSVDYIKKFSDMIEKLFILPFKLTGIDALLTKWSASDFAMQIKRTTHNERAMKNLANNRTDEYMSDSFAMMYGYGAQQSSALTRCISTILRIHLMIFAIKFLL